VRRQTSGRSLTRCCRAAKRAGISETEIQRFVTEATTGSYGKMIDTCQRWFDCD
jgi:hypothetical protein